MRLAFLAPRDVPNRPQTTQETKYSHIRRVFFFYTSPYWYYFPYISRYLSPQFKAFVFNALKRPKVKLGRQIDVCGVPKPGKPGSKNWGDNWGDNICLLSFGENWGDKQTCEVINSLKTDIPAPM
jgi:hypothetical protein